MNYLDYLRTDKFPHFWCSGCGNGIVLCAIARAFEELDLTLENTVVVTGIGCWGKADDYVRTNSFHGTHGRALAFATGIKLANPSLNVVVLMGDGDGITIGGNHFIHSILRNIDLNVVLFNNEIYGLTKGQYSPTSKLGKITKTSPYGTVERPFNPGELVIGAHGTFFARSIDAEVNLTTECMVAASKHDGLSVIEVLVNCMIFNNGTHKAFAGDKEVRAEHTITLRQGEKMLFGKNMDKGLMLDNMKLKVVTVGENGVTLDDILVHDAHEKDTMVHVMLASMKYPDFPVALGIIRDVAEPTYEREVARQIAEVQATAKIKNVDDLLNSGETWEVE